MLVPPWSLHTLGNYRIEQALIDCQQNALQRSVKAGLQPHRPDRTVSKYLRADLISMLRTALKSIGYSKQRTARMNVLRPLSSSSAAPGVPVTPGVQRKERSSNKAELVGH